MSDLSTFGGYRLSSRIATGGMAEVYLARRINPDGSLGHSVALKRLLPHLVRESNVVRMFLNEAKITAQIAHTNVVRIVDIGHQDGEPFIAMELLDGRSFAEVRQKAALTGERVPLGITLRVLTDACRGLDAAHRAKDQEGKPLSIVHRDFSPDNIHVGVRGDVKVIDFGIAKAENMGSGTEPGTLKGKFYYMSPEMILGKAVDHRADLFAAGVMLYEQLCGRRPFTGETTDQVLTRIAEGRPRKPTEFDPSVPVELEAICLMALSKDPEKRFNSLEIFIQAIEAVGGRSELASRDEVGEYVRKTFPIEKDPKRQALQKAIELDPSNPSHPAPAGVRKTPRPQLRPTTGTPPGAVATADGRPQTPAPLKKAEGVAIRIPASGPAPVPAAVEAAAVEEAPADEVAPAPSRKLPLKAIGGVVGAIAIAAAVAVVALRPGATVAERLSKAGATNDRGARVELLVPIASDPKATADELSLAGELLAAAGAVDEALPLADALEKRFAEDPRGPVLEARAAVAGRLAKRAEAAIAKAAAADPRGTQPEVLLAELREAQGDYGGAADALGKARAKHDDPKLAARHGVLLSKLSRLDDAAEALGVALQKEFDAQAGAELGFVRFRQDRIGDARSLLNRAVKKAPQDFTAHYYLGAVLFRQGEPAAAEKEYLEADRLAPEDPRALAALCEVQAKSGKAQDAEATKALLTKRFPKQAQVLIAGCTP